jgi:hypothetical protein
VTWSKFRTEDPKSRRVLWIWPLSAVSARCPPTDTDLGIQRRKGGCNDYAEKLGSTVQTLVAQATRCPVFVHPCPTTLHFRGDSFNPPYSTFKLEDHLFSAVCNEFLVTLHFCRSRPKLGKLRKRHAVILRVSKNNFDFVSERSFVRLRANVCILPQILNSNSKLHKRNDTHFVLLLL